MYVSNEEGLGTTPRADHWLQVRSFTFEPYSTSHATVGRTGPAVPYNFLIVI